MLVDCPEDLPQEAAGPADFLNSPKDSALSSGEGSIVPKQPEASKSHGADKDYDVDPTEDGGVCLLLRSNRGQLSVKYSDYSMKFFCYDCIVLLLYCSLSCLMQRTASVKGGRCRQVQSIFSNAGGIGQHRLIVKRIWVSL